MFLAFGFSPFLSPMSGVGRLFYLTESMDSHEIVGTNKIPSDLEGGVFHTLGRWE